MDEKKIDFHHFSCVPSDSEVMCFSETSDRYNNIYIRCPTMICTSTSCFGTFWLTRVFLQWYGAHYVILIA